MSRRSVAAGLAVLALAVPACRLHSSTSADSVGERERAEAKASAQAVAAAPSPPVKGAPTLEVTASATEAAFQPKVLKAKPGTVNIHWSTPGNHNFSLTGPGITLGIVWGEPFGAPADVTHSIDLVAGSYQYVCTVHPTMTGVLTVT